ncbi:type II secretion system minor pseudopilin GspJ [Marinobacter sp. V034]|uniref:type II secretion system minor pseudopilin GspJ n=1 Tax=Marinobacter sp. V034 TaxID=3459610 RepID=UPI004044D49A
MISDSRLYRSGPKELKSSGFTLMEVLVAVAMTAFIGLGVWQTISGIIRARDSVDRVADEFADINKAMAIIERDIVQIVNRPVRDIYGESRMALTSREEAYELSLTHQGWRNPTGALRSELQRAAYEFTGDELHRRYWAMLDQAQDAGEGRDQLLLTGVTDFNVRFMNDQYSWVDDWPTAEGAQESTGQQASVLPLPKGIEVTVEIDNYGELKRVFVLPDFDAKAAQGFVSNANAINDSDDEPSGEDSEADAGNAEQEQPDVNLENPQ